MTTNYARDTFEDFFSKNKALPYGDKLNTISFFDKYNSCFEAKNQSINLFQAIKSYLDSKNEYIISLVYKLCLCNKCNEHRKFIIANLIFVTNSFNIYSVEPIPNKQLKTNQHKIYDLDRNAILVINPLKEYNIKLQNCHIDYLKSLSILEVIIRTSGPRNSTVYSSNIKSVFNDKLNIYCKESSGIPQNIYLEQIMHIYDSYAKELAYSLKLFNSILEKDNNLKDLDNVNIELKNLIDNLYSEINNKNKKINSLEYEVKNMNLELLELEYENNSLYEEIESLKGIVNKLKSENQNNTNIIESLTNSVNFQCSRIEDLEIERENNWHIPKPF